MKMIWKDNGDYIENDIINYKSNNNSFEKLLMSQTLWSWHLW